MMQSKNWCFTINNYNTNDLHFLKNAKHLRYFVCGEEKGKNNTPHIQGFVQFSEKKRMTALKKLHARAHWEVMRGKPTQASEYCKKDDSYIEEGTLVTQGQRTDVDNIYAELRNNKNKGMGELLNDFDLNSQHIRIVENYFKYKEEGRDFKTNVIWIWGESGKGKSKLAKEMGLEKCAEVYYKDSTKWWDGYDKHNVVIWDDFRGNDVKFSELLKIIDRYPHRVESKGGSRQLLAKTMIFTSIKHPKEIYSVGDEPIQQLLRRIDVIFKM